MLLAVGLVVALEPAALAMPAPHSMPETMQTMHCESHGKADCDHSMPQSDQKAPCKNMASCLGMLNCTAMAATPVYVADVAPPALTVLPSWRSLDVGPGITITPDNPPPIV